MIDFQSIAATSPKGTDLFAYDDETSDAKRRPALVGLLTRRLSTTFSRTAYEDYGKPASSPDDTHRQIKMQIIDKNPAIYQMFRERLKENFYTHWGVCYSLHDFLDNTLRLPELREEITNHRFSASARPRVASGIFAYLTGEGSPLTRQKRLGSESNSVSPQNTKCTGNDALEDLSAKTDALSIPSLESTEHKSYDNSVSDESGSSNRSLSPVQTHNLSVPSLDSTGHKSDDDDSLSDGSGPSGGSSNSSPNNTLTFSFCENSEHNCDEVSLGDGSGLIISTFSPNDETLPACI